MASSAWTTGNPLNTSKSFYSQSTSTTTRTSLTGSSSLLIHVTRTKGLVCVNSSPIYHFWVVCFDANQRLSSRKRFSVRVWRGFNLRDNSVFSLAAAKSFHLVCCKLPEQHCVTGLKDGDMLTLSECSVLCTESYSSRSFCFNFKNHWLNGSTHNCSDWAFMSMNKSESLPCISCFFLRWFLN